MDSNISKLTKSTNWKDITPFSFCIFLTKEQYQVPPHFDRAPHIFEYYLNKTESWAEIWERVYPSGGIKGEHEGTFSPLPPVGGSAPTCIPLRRKKNDNNQPILANFCPLRNTFCLFNASTKNSGAAIGLSAILSLRQMGPVSVTNFALQWHICPVSPIHNAENNYIVQLH